MRAIPWSRLWNLAKQGRWSDIRYHLSHGRYPLFWLLAAVALVLPWMLQRLPESGIPLLAVSDAKPVGATCSVLNVYDGDTMTLNCDGNKTKVRMMCIDTPEMKQGEWGRLSRDALRELAPVGTSVVLSAKETDRYGRTVGEVWRDGQSLNLAQVERGKAAVYRRYCSDTRFTQAETRAKYENIGIWASGNEALQQTPWEYRHK